MLISKLDGFNNSQCFVNRTANRQVMNVGNTKDTLRINDKQTTEGNSFLWNQDYINILEILLFLRICLLLTVVISGNFLVNIRNKRDVD